MIRISGRPILSGLLRLLSLAALLALFPPAAGADLEFKKKVINNCEQALAAFKELDHKGQVELIPDLKLLLNLQSTKLDGPRPDIAKLGPFDSPVGDVPGQELWKGFQPDRDINVKRCAVEILSLLSPHSAETTPDLIRLSADKTLPNDFRMMIDQTIAAITVKAAQAEVNVVSDETFRDLIELLDGETTIRAENVLLELRERTVDFLLREIQKPDAKLRHRIVEGLLRIDDSGEIIGKGVLKLLDSGDDGLRRRAAQLLGELENTAAESVPALIERLSDISPEVEEGAANALGAILSSAGVPRINLSQAQLKELIGAFERANPAYREQLRIALSKLGPGTPSFSEALPALLKNKDPLLRASTVRLLGSIDSTPEMMNALSAALNDKVLAVRLEAIDALGNHKGSPQLVAALVKVLRENSKEANLDSKQLVLQHAAKTVMKLNLGAAGIPLLPFLIEALRYGDAAFPAGPAAEAAKQDELPAMDAVLISFGKEAVPSLTRALGHKDPQVRRRAGLILASIRPPEPAAISALAQQLKNPELRKPAAGWLIAIGGSSISEARKVYRSPNVPAKLEAAKVLLALGEKDKALYSLVLESARKESCPGKASLAVAVPALREFAPPAFFEELIDCLISSPASAEAAVEALVAVSPLPAAAHPKLIQFFASPDLPKKIQLQMLEKAVNFGLPPDQLLSLLTGSLRESDKPVQFRVLSILRGIGPASKDTVPQLMKFLDDNKSDRLLANEAALALTLIDQQAFDYVDFFRKELAEDGYQWAQNSIRKLPPSAAHPILNRALNELPLDKKCRAIELIGESGPAGSYFTPQLMNFTSAPDERLGYCATVALLKIDPAKPELEAPLKREMRGDFRKDLLNEKFPEALIPALEAVQKDSSSYVERKIASLLLRRVKKTK